MAARATMNGTSQAGRCGLSLWLTMVLTLCLGLSACGGGSDSETPPDAAQPPSPPTASDFKLLPARVGLTVGGQGAMSALQAPGAVTWASSNPAVASIDSAGLVTAQAVGSAVISPGVIKTEMTRYLWENPEHAARAAERVALKRLGLTDDVARAALFFSTEDSGFTTGTEFPVDGGFAWR